MDKVAKALDHETKPLGHKDYLGFDSALSIVGTNEPLMISLIDDDKKLGGNLTSLFNKHKKSVDDEGKDNSS